ncbi:hypothetical protein NQ315_001562 [Exocentrus adspersus]|uniref:Uncharacterized protein n=1 Tax=Exocentrus adspersus TaxID=1586481 RepID=A0AAV8W951_9CUCU|nr:hypothetical protein NQ315_001562 [Exocentrus adspersus]
MVSKNCGSSDVSPQSSLPSQYPFKRMHCPFLQGNSLILHAGPLLASCSSPITSTTAGSDHNHILEQRGGVSFWYR